MRIERHRFGETSPFLTVWGGLGVLGSKHGLLELLC